MLYLHNPPDILQVIFEFLIHEFCEILSRHLIFRVKLRLHFIQERFLDCVGAFLRGDMRDCSSAARAPRAAEFGLLCHQILRRIHRKWKTITVYITEIIPVAARDDCGDACITHPFATLAFIIQEFGFGFGFGFAEVLSWFIRFDVILYFNDRVVTVIYWPHARTDHDCFRLLLRFIKCHFLILDEFIHEKHLEFGVTHMFLLVAVGFNKRVIGRVVFLIEINRNVAVIVFFDCVFIRIILRENEAESLRAACFSCGCGFGSGSGSGSASANHRTRRPQFIALFA